MTEELPDLPEMTDLEPLPETPGGAVTKIAANPGAALGTKRQLEEAPLQLRKAAKILVLGALLPMAGVRITEFPDHVLPWLNLYGAKAIALVAMWIYYQGQVATYGGGTAFGPVAQLSKTHKLTVPILVCLLSFGALYFLFASPLFDTASFWAKSTSFTEVATVILGAATLAHIYGYEHGGRFNPIFPLMFLGPGLGGVFAIFNGFSAMASSAGPAKLAAGLGLLSNVIVGIGGLLAMWVMYKSMRQAKVEGDLKRTAQREARKAARQARG